MWRLGLDLSFDGCGRALSMLWWMVDSEADMVDLFSCNNTLVSLAVITVAQVRLQYAGGTGQINTLVLSRGHSNFDLLKTQIVKYFHTITGPVYCYGVLATTILLLIFSMTQ